MVAPIDAKVSFEVEGETFTLRLNFRTLSLARAECVDLLSGKDLHALDIGPAVRCLAVQDHPDMTDETAFALSFNHGEVIGNALTELFDKFGGGAEGNAPAKKMTRRKKT